MEKQVAIEILLALGQTSRLDVYRAIVSHADVGVQPSQLCELLNIPPATLSFHLKALYHAGLISVERQSRNLIYRPEVAVIEQLSEFLLSDCCGGRKSCMPKSVIVNQLTATKKKKS